MDTCSTLSIDIMGKVSRQSKSTLDPDLVVQCLSSCFRNYSTENLKYLTTEMAIEDVAHFIAYQKSLDTFKNSKVVVVGKSYSATMATWLREKYPHLVDIAYSSSAPLIAVVDFYGKIDCFMVTRNCYQSLAIRLL